MTHICIGSRHIYADRKQALTFDIYMHYVGQAQCVYMNQNILPNQNLLQVRYTITEDKE